MKTLRTFFVSGFLLAIVSAQAQVVINEIFYHAPDDLTDLQWIELYNTSDRPVNLVGWRFSKALKFQFAADTPLPAHGYAVICRSRQRFEEFYQAPVAGEFGKALKHGGERLELRNSDGRVVDSVEFGTRPPWPRAADGWTASLERICPTAPGNLAENWSASPLSEESTRPGGTPGKKNGAFCATLPPVISQVSFASNCIPPGQPLRLEARVQSKTPLKSVTLLYRVIGPGSAGDETSVPMENGDAGGHYAASIPGQQAGQIVRVRVRAVDQDLAERLFPGPNEPRPALSCLVLTNVTPGKIPVAYLIHTDVEEAQSAARQVKSGGRAAPFSPEGQARMMAEMQFRSALDLGALWADLTCTNCTADELEELRPVFRRQLREYEALEQKSLSGTDLEQLIPRIPSLVQPFKAALGDALKPALNADQAKVFEKWRDGAPPAGRPGPPGGDPASMLRQFVRLEPDYLHLSVGTNLNAAQMVQLRDVYRDALQKREALLPDLRKLMARGPQGQDQAEGEKLQAKAEAIPAAVDKALGRILTPSQTRQLSSFRSSDEPAFMRHGRSKPPEPAVGQCAFVVVDPGTRETRLFDFVRIPERSGGWKVHFGRDQPWNGLTAVDLIFEASDRWLLAEPLAYDLHRRAGLAACRTDFLRLMVDGQPAGYYLMIEQPNKAFLRHNGLRDDGNMYKANWVGNGLEGQNEKHINRHTGHEDLVQLVDQLEKTKKQPDQQWALIQREFDVDEVVSHYAVRLLISDWDGFFNNYFLYHDLRGTGKWTFYPWDEDKTWGEYDSYEQQGLLYNMPLSYGAEGDYPPGETAGRPSGSYGFRQWWRAGGYISRPLLANPTFRKYFLARIKNLLDSEFTEARLFPLVDAFRERLKEEIAYRAQVTNENPEVAQKRFDSNLASLKEFITKRRQWLLEQEEVRTAGTYDRAQLK